MTDVSSGISSSGWCFAITCCLFGSWIASCSVNCLPGFRRFTSADAWRYQSAKELGHINYWGTMATFSGGGAIQDLDILRNNTEAIIRVSWGRVDVEETESFHHQELREHLWIDRSTRVVMVDFTTYNANANLFCVVKLAFEFPPTGGLQLSSTFRTVKLLRYVGREDFWVFAFEILFCCFVLYYGVEEVMEIKKAKLDYFQSAWNVMDMVVIGISLFNIFIAVYTEFVVRDLLKVNSVQYFCSGDSRSN